MEVMGKIIVIEGTDGSGKGTQAELLRKRLAAAGWPADSLSFPRYGEKAAAPAEAYLLGEFGDPAGIDPYAASLFFAIDRFAVKPFILDKLSAGKMLVLDRYVDSNAGHQGGKISDPEERAKFLAWLYATEYEVLKVPRPDLVFILHVPAEVGQRLVLEKAQRQYLGNAKQDGHEANLQHLKNAEASYLWLAKHDPEIHCLVECMDGERLKSPEEVHELIWGELKKRIYGEGGG